MRAPGLVSVLVLAVGCGPTPRNTGNNPGPGGGGNYPPGSFGAACTGQTTSLTGVALAPNENDPVPSAHVYVVAAPTPVTPGVSCDICDKPLDRALVETTSGSDGHFTLTLDKIPSAATVKLVVAKGRFRRVTEIPVSACTAAMAPKAALALPGTHAEGDMPKIAVTSGSQDHLDVVLDALGIKEFDCYVGTTRRSSNNKTPCANATTDVEALLSDPAKLAGYNMLFISCAPGKYAALADPAGTVKNLEGWVKNGGRLFATDESYNYIEQTFPGYIDFYPGTTNASMPEPVDAANLGVGASVKKGGASYPGTVTDPDLETWLHAVGAIPPEANTITLNGFLNPWAAQKDVSKDVRTAVTATAAYYTGGSTSIGSPSTTATMPMTVEFDYQMCGRVLFSSYHTLGSTQKGQKLSAQEMILEYLMLDIGSCLGPIG